jgi:DNA-binding NarL/FixJ family response regulator
MAALTRALEAAPAAAVVDLHEQTLDPLAVIAALHAAGVRVLAFGRHTDPALLRDAREAGATTVVPRSQLVEQLEVLLRALLSSSPAAPH